MGPSWSTRLLSAHTAFEGQPCKNPPPEPWGGHIYWLCWVSSSVKIQEHLPRDWLLEPLPKRVKWSRLQRWYHNGHMRLLCPLEPEDRLGLAHGGLKTPASLRKRRAETIRPRWRVPGPWPLDAGLPSQALLSPALQSPARPQLGLFQPHTKPGKHQPADRDFFRVCKEQLF